jgi:hypothetical protein
VASFEGDPDHPILPDASGWELVEFTYRCDPADWRESYIDLVFERDGNKRRLRFFAPKNLEMSRGLPNSSGMCIQGVSGRQLEGMRVRVTNFEEPSGATQFWAAEVVEITEPTNMGRSAKSHPTDT